MDSNGRSRKPELELNFRPIDPHVSFCFHQESAIGLSFDHLQSLGFWFVGATMLSIFPASVKSFAWTQA